MTKKREQIDLLKLRVEKVTPKRGDIVLLRLSTELSKEDRAQLMNEFSDMLHEVAQVPICVLGCANGISDFIALDDVALKSLGLMRIPDPNASNDKKFHAPLQTSRFS
jgi:hypothetical protein